ncbi:methyltransferase domain-containing protein [Conchiformibius steedae]|uniref:methyltransferase domain-containing protein n=1 Tax=Conchiformibius steedae TaxID=153493 RepID=UPI0026EAA998|nr:methyltransferase domain-containing protein [Conchiformibius steedae]
MIQTVSDLRQWWEKSELGQYVYAQEWDFFQQAAGSLAGRRTLLTGAFTEQSAAQMATQGALWQCATLPADVLAEETVLPWRDNVFDVVLTAHAGDFGVSVATWLAELYRVVRPFGCVVLTGFNPYSLWRIGGNVPQVAQSLPFTQFKSCVAQAGWQVAQGRFMHYLPPVDSAKWLHRMRFMELAGNRWWPHGAAVYGLVLRKQRAGMRWQADAQPCGFAPEAVVLGAAKQPFTGQNAPNGV